MNRPKSLSPAGAAILTLPILCFPLLALAISLVVARQSEVSVDQEHRHAIVRFSTTIQPGEMQTIFVPGPYGSPPHEMHIRQLGDQIEVLSAGAGRPDD